MKKLILSVTLAVIISQTMFAQNAVATAAGSDTIKNPKNSIYVEVAGPTLFGASLNYERFFSKKPGGLSIKIGYGIGTAPGLGENNDATFNVLPVGLSYNLPVSQNRRSFIELGAEIIFVSSNDGNEQVVAPVAAWRWQTKSGAFQLRAGFLFFVSSPTPNDNSYGLVPWPAISLGTKF